jgi:hypothetical protein
MRSKNEVLCAEAGSLAAERSEHIKPILLWITHTRTIFLNLPRPIIDLFTFCNTNFQIHEYATVVVAL